MPIRKVLPAYYTQAQAFRLKLVLNTNGFKWLLMVQDLLMSWVRA